jgi:DNA-binding protein H-NS
MLELEFVSSEESAEEEKLADQFTPKKAACRKARPSVQTGVLKEGRVDGWQGK